MKADTFNATERFFAPIQMILKIPVYQRNYDWNKNNVHRLLNDLYEVIKTGKQHFLGAVVYMESNNSDVGMPEYLIIDGQQRLTTITLMLQALKDIDNGKDPLTNGTIRSYLTNSYSTSDEYKIKLKPIKSDNIQYTALLRHEYEKLDDSSHIVENYELAKQTFTNWRKDGILSRQILEAIKKLQVVGISLKEGEDDPQVIFESINSTGVALTNSDLIRNFLLMSDHDQERLFEDYWLPIENTLRRDNTNRTMDAFFRQFMIMKENSTVTERNVYSEFSDYFHENHYTHESALKELLRYSKLYASFLYPSESSYSDSIRTDLADLKRIDQSTCYPFLMHVFNDYQKKEIDENILAKVVHLITIYLIRRTICDVPSNSLLGFFANYYARTFKVDKNKAKYYEAINKYLFSQTNRNEVPDDTQLENALIHSRLYLNKNLCDLLMLDIENGGSKEKLATKDLTIEHIMPQTMSKSWRKNISDEEHDAYVHTLGNLSVTGYNSEMSNKSFAEKKQILKQNSKAVILNKDVIDKDQWTIDDIKKRGQRLAAILMKRYELTPITDPKIEFEAVDKIYLSDPSSATGRKPVSFTLEGANYPVKTFKEITTQVIQILDQDDPERLGKLIGLTWKNNFNKPNSNNSVVICHKEDIKPTMAWRFSEIRDGIYVMVGGSAWTIMRVLKLLIDAYQIDEKEFSISVKAKKEENTTA